MIPDLELDAEYQKLAAFIHPASQKLKAVQSKKKKKRTHLEVHFHFQ